MKKFAARVVGYLLAPELRPIEIRVARAAGLALIAWLGATHA